jgi:hypothetical protein
MSFTLSIILIAAAIAVSSIALLIALSMVKAGENPPDSPRKRQ